MDTDEVHIPEFETIQNQNVTYQNGIMGGRQRANRSAYIVLVFSCKCAINAQALCAFYHGCPHLVEYIREKGGGAESNRI